MTYLVIKQIDQIEDHTRNRSGSFHIPFLQRVADNFGENDRFVEVLHVVWKTFRKVGILTYIDEFGVRTNDLMVTDDRTSQTWRKEKQ